MRIAIGLALVVCLAAAPAQALVPTTINFQGILTDGLGGIIADGNYGVMFSLYNSATSGAPLWSETQTVSTSAGLFNTELGSSTAIPDSALMDTAAYLEITVETDPPISPRTRLVSAPYSFMSRALRGEGPVRLEHFDPSSGASGSMDLSMEQNAATNDRVKVKFHWDTDYPSTGDSSRYDFIMTPDSTYESKRQHKPFQVCKVVEQTASDLQKVVVLCATGSADTSVSVHTVSTIDGIVDSSTTKTTGGQATGKRVHKPFRIVKEWNASNASASTSLNSTVDVDTGFTQTAGMTKADLISEIATKATQTREHVLLSRQVGVPGSTADQLLELLTDNDSNMVRMSSTDNASGETASLALDIVPNAANSSKNIRKNISVIASSRSAASSETLGLDSGLTRSISIADASHSLDVFQRFGTAPAPPTKTMPIAIPNLLDARKSGNESSGNEAHSRLVLDADTGYVQTAGMTKSDLISEIAHEATQTREHILLSRQVGVPGATDHSSLELQTNDIGARAQLHRGTTTDSSGLEILAADDSTKLTLYSRTTGARYSNIVLKRGFSTGAEFSLGYDGAASSARIYATSNPAAGAQLGINTTTPTAAFQLVGDGCYTGTFGACSDRRYKDHIETLTNSLDAVSRLRGVRFDWKQKEFPQQRFPDGEQIGLIAQEVEDVVPSVVHTGSDGYKSVDYAKLVALLIEGMKEQQQQIDELKAELAQQRQ